jgi:hypothetical protein
MISLGKEESSRLAKGVAFQSVYSNLPSSDQHLISEASMSQVRDVFGTTCTPLVQAYR